MAENESFEALAVQNKEQKRQGNEQNDGDFVGEELEGDYNEEEEEEEEKEEKENQLSELQQIVPNSQKEEEVREEQVETLTVAPQSSTEIIPKENDRYSDDLAGLKGNSAAETHVEAEHKEQVGSSHQEVLGNVADKSSEAQTQNQLQPSLCPTSLSELSPTSVTQPISSAPSPSPAKKNSPPEVKNAGITEAGDRSSSGLKALNVPVARTSIPDGYNWRKYGQKQVKSPKGSRSYYKCTYFDCCAKKIECSDHSGHVIEIVNKGMHCHDPPRKNKGTRKSRSGLSVGPILQTTVTEHTVRMLKDSEPDTLSMELVQETSAISERKRQSSSSSDESKETQIKEENIGEPEPKRRLKGNLECSKSVLKPGKKPKFVVHAAGDVGITGDGYRWRKYGQKMVKGNPHPRNYYRCTSAGCPVRKHIETAVDNTNAVIITYKGVHDHDMPVPKKRHGPPSAPLVAAAAPAAMSNLPIKKTDAVQSQVTSTQWSVGKEGELTGETLDLGGEKEKAIESARTLLSIGFEIKPF